jgi:hypothetical protein
MLHETTRGRANTAPLWCTLEDGYPHEAARWGNAVRDDPDSHKLHERLKSLDREYTPRHREGMLRLL